MTRWYLLTLLLVTASSAVAAEPTAICGQPG
jgi:hypothetical protein